MMISLWASEADFECKIIAPLGQHWDSSNLHQRNHEFQMTITSAFLYGNDSFRIKVFSADLLKEPSLNHADHWPSFSSTISLANALMFSLLHDRQALAS
jgi:hypothetical protein